MGLEDCRSRIDSIDRRLLELFVERMGVVAEVAEIKRRSGMPVLNSSREQEILDKVASSAGPEFAEYAMELFRKLMELSRAYQNRRLSAQSSDNSSK